MFSRFRALMTPRIGAQSVFCNAAKARIRAAKLLKIFSTARSRARLLLESGNASNQ
jgi:hypothetical protein